MNKKLKYLASIPLYGTCILFVYLFVLSIKDRISKNKFMKMFSICAIVSAICWYMIGMILYITSKKIIYFNFSDLGILLTMIIAGYMMNAFTFTYIDKKWDYLTNFNEEEKKPFLEVSKKKILRIAFVLAVVITILALVSIFAFELI